MQRNATLLLLQLLQLLLTKEFSISLLLLRYYKYYDDDNRNISTKNKLKQKEQKVSYHHDIGARGCEGAAGLSRNRTEQNRTVQNRTERNGTDGYSVGCASCNN
ncbi:hypothetical protein M0804_010711 [Polistes exclamans]|nr:hypothetical protein M0804_010711 [Polistes exclamans]